MATAPAKQIEELLECSICTETLTQPRTLSCFHSFCKHCLANFVATRKKAVKKGAKVPEVFECPVCRSEFHVKHGESIENMPSNHFINNMLELLNLTQESQNISCQSCKARNPATSRCVSCENYLCKKCLEVHNNWPAFEEHVVLTLEELAKPENRAKARGKPRCEKHNKVLKFYCETCKVLVCRYCVDVNHARSQHLWFPLEDVIEQHKKAFLASSAIFEQQVNEAAQSSVNIKHAISSLLHNAMKAKDAIIQQQQEILSAFTKKLEQETATLLGKVDVKYKKADGLLVKQQDNVKDYLEKAKSSLDFARNVISNASNEELLFFKPEVEKKARDIKNERPEFMKPIHNGFFAYQAKQCEDILQNIKLNDLGKIDTVDYQIRKEMLEDDNVEKLSKQQISNLEHLCEVNGIKVTIEKELKRILLVGHREDIAKMCTEIFKILRKIDETEKEKKKAALQADKWYYEDPLTGDHEEYDKQTNAIIEEAYRKKEKSVIFLLDDERCEIVFSKMRETNLVRNEEMKVIRKDVKAEVCVPDYWEPQPLDASGRELAVHLAPLNPNDPKHQDEYTNISAHFNQTAREQILAIHRVQNPSLFKLYGLKKQSLDKKNGSNEKFLFCGARGDRLNEINEHGLNRSFAGNTDGTLYGKGISFARDASMCVRYAQPVLSTGRRYMYFTRVAVGDYTVGNQGMLVPPSKRGGGNDSYDSVVNDTRNPTIFVLFFDDQYYPEYLITFQ